MRQVTRSQLREGHEGSGCFGVSPQRMNNFIAQEEHEQNTEAVEQLEHKSVRRGDVIGCCSNLKMQKLQRFKIQILFFLFCLDFLSLQKSVPPPLK